MEVPLVPGQAADALEQAEEQGERERRDLQQWRRSGGGGAGGVPDPGLPSDAASDDEAADAAVGGDEGLKLCSLCGGKAHGRRLKACPVLQMALAVPEPAHQGEPGSGSGEEVAQQRGCLSLLLCCWCPTLLPAVSYCSARSLGALTLPGWPPLQAAPCARTRNGPVASSAWGVAGRAATQSTSSAPSSSASHGCGEPPGWRRWRLRPGTSWWRRRCGWGCRGFPAGLHGARAGRGGSTGRAQGGGTRGQARHGAQRRCKRAAGGLDVAQLKGGASAVPCEKLHSRSTQCCAGPCNQPAVLTRSYTPHPSAHRSLPALPCTTWTNPASPGAAPQRRCWRWGCWLRRRRSGS